MRHSLPSIAALLALSGAAMQGALPAPSGPRAESPSQKVQSQNNGTPPKSIRQIVADAVFGSSYIRRHRAPLGKRYSASVRQHQRHAAKLRNKAAHRRANR